MLRVTDLSVTLRGPRLLGPVSFTLARGTRLGLIGESGSGKTLTALALMGLLPRGARVGGQAFLDGTALLHQPEHVLEKIRGRQIGMVFQEPMSALNPAMRIGAQIAEPLRQHLGLDRTSALRRALALLDAVRMPHAGARLHAFAHELSGGQRQRVGIAMAIAAEPAILIADEPTTALDVSVQAEILDLLDAVIAKQNMGLILITHDAAVTARLARHVLVLYAGSMLEYGPAARILSRPAHPYSAALQRARPGGTVLPGGRLPAIPGQVPSPERRPDGCVFRDRCPRAAALCTTPPAWREIEAGHYLACHFPV